MPYGRGPLLMRHGAGPERPNGDPGGDTRGIISSEEFAVDLVKAVIATARRDDSIREFPGELLSHFSVDAVASWSPPWTI